MFLREESSVSSQDWLHAEKFIPHSIRQEFEPSLHACEVKKKDHAQNFPTDNKMKTDHAGLGVSSPFVPVQMNTSRPPTTYVHLLERRKKYNVLNIQIMAMQ